MFQVSEYLLYFDHHVVDVNVAMAVAIDGGLITPTIIKAQEQDLFSISRNWKELVDKAKNKKLTPAEYTSGTALDHVTISVARCLLHDDYFADFFGEF